MTHYAVFIAAAALLLAFGLVTGAWLTMAQVEADMRSLGGFEGMRFGIGTHGAQTEGASWRIPG